jgi:hypothetical protein
MGTMAMLNFSDGRKVRLREIERHDPISFLPGMNTHRIAIHLEAETLSGVAPETYPLVTLSGEVHLTDQRGVDHWIGPLASSSLILRPDSVAPAVHGLGVLVDDAAVLALDEAIGGQDFTLRIELRAQLTASSAYPEANETVYLRVSADLWQRQLKQLHRTVSFTGRIPVPTTVGALAAVAKHLEDAEQKLLSAEWNEAVRFTRLAQELMKQHGGLPPATSKPLDDRTLDEKYANALRAVFELASVPQHNGVAQQQPLGRADAYAFYWMTAALYYKLIEVGHP